jgi:hypothetical protein
MPVHDSGGGVADSLQCDYWRVFEHVRGDPVYEHGRGVWRERGELWGGNGGDEYREL